MDSLPLGDRIVFDVHGKLELTHAMCSLPGAGGPSQTVAGRIILTEQRLVFRPVVGQPHPQVVDQPRDPAWQVRFDTQCCIRPGNKAIK